MFLVGSYVPHQVLTINTIIEKYNAEIHSISVSKNFTYIPKENENLKTYKLQDFTKEDLLKRIMSIDPDLLVVAGWMIPEYVWVAKRIKKTTEIPVVAMSDTPWYGTLRQKLNSIISPFHIQKAFTHLWVAGIYQYDYARKLGFKNEQIIYNCLSADTDLFSAVNIDKKNEKYPKNFLYLGRYTEVKGLQNLMKAWSNIKDKKGWTFTLVGNGEMREELINYGNFIVKDYMSQDLLKEELENTGCLVLPSLKEPWALVIHEAASAGIPVICTKTCGAAPHFVIDGYNGYQVENNSVAELTKAMEKIIDKDNGELLSYCYNSRKLSNVITPDKSVASIMQLILDK